MIINSYRRRNLAWIKKIRVFLSRPNPFTKEQQYFIEKLKSTLDKYNIESITMQAKDYSPYESLTVLNELY